MSVRRVDPVQPSSFEFTPDNLKWADEQISKYPEGKQASAVISLLWRAQEQHDGWLPEPAIRCVAEKLGMAEIRVLEIATFYTMFNLSPVGKYFIQLCGTTPCMLRGSDDLKQVCLEEIGPQSTVSDDGLFSWLEVECLGACCNAPMVQINKYYYEDLTAESLRGLLKDLREGKEVPIGTRADRQFAAPAGGQTTLLEKFVPPWRTNGIAAGPSTDTAVAALSSSNEVPSDNASTADATSSSSGERPEGLDAPVGGRADDLKLISGVGPKLEGTLNSLGIFHFSQIADWTKAHVDWVDDYLSFKGRIEREDWIAQARKLAAGEETEFSSRQKNKEDDA